LRGARPRVFPPLRGRRASRQCNRHPQARRATRRPLGLPQRKFRLSHPGEPRWFASSWASFGELLTAICGYPREIIWESQRFRLRHLAWASLRYSSRVRRAAGNAGGGPPLHGRGFFICAGERQQPLPQCGFSASSSSREPPPPRPLCKPLGPPAPLVAIPLEVVQRPTQLVVAGPDLAKDRPKAPRQGIG